MLQWLSCHLWLPGSLDAYKLTSVCEYVIPKLQLVAAVQPAQTASPKPVSKKPSPDSDLHPVPPASPKFVRPAIKKPLPVSDPPPAAAALGAGSAALTGGTTVRVRHADMAQSGSSVLSSCQSSAETASV